VTWRPSSGVVPTLRRRASSPTRRDERLLRPPGAWIALGRKRTRRRLRPSRKSSGSWLPSALTRGWPLAPASMPKTLNYAAMTQFTSQPRSNSVTRKSSWSPGIAISREQASGLALVLLGSSRPTSQRLDRPSRSRPRPVRSRQRSASCSSPGVPSTLGSSASPRRARRPSSCRTYAEGRGHALASRPPFFSARLKRRTRSA
jgi:hypothetical protein